MFLQYYIAVAAGSAIVDTLCNMSSDEPVPDHPLRYTAVRALVAPIAFPAILTTAAMAVYASGLENGSFDWKWTSKKEDEDADPAASHKTT